MESLPIAGLWAMEFAAMSGMDDPRKIPYETLFVATANKIIIHDNR